MIDYDRTLSVLGIDINKLLPKSNKMVFTVCEECGKYRKTKYCQAYILCQGCSQLGKKNHRYGIHPSNETLKKLIDSHLGGCVHHSEITRRRMSKTRLGRPNPLHSEATKKKMSESRSGEKHHMYGKHHSEATKKKMSNSSLGKLSGKNSPHWKGGLSFGKYCYKFNTSFKEEIRNQYNRMCFLCPTTEKENGRKLSVHHVSYEKNCMCNSRCEFVPLCDRCHCTTNYNRQYWEDIIMCYLYPKQAWLPDI